jgi:hypothetical protein
MALSDPQTITINAVAQVCALVSADATKSVYMTPDEVYRFTVSHQASGNRVRRMVRIDKKVVAADPLTAINAYQSLGIYIVVDEPANGAFADADIQLILTGFKTWLDATNFGKVLTSQH